MLSQVRWLRAVVAAFLIEVCLIVFTLPFILIIAEAVVFKAIVPLACLVVPFVVTFFALVLSASSIAEAVASYGSVALLAGVNVLRIVSATAGGYAADRRTIPSAA